MFQFKMVLAITITLLVVGFSDGSALSGIRRSNENQYRWREFAKEQTTNDITRSQLNEETDNKGSSQSKFRNSDEHKYVGNEEKPVEHRIKRSYYPYPSYTHQLPQFQSINMWRPNMYPFQRPYYVPIYGLNGRVPIYIPPQPFYISPIIPPRPPYVGPTYLPPIKPTYLPPVTQPTVNETMTTVMPTDNRFGTNDEDDRPIWSNNDGNETTQRPSNVPTRKPPSSSGKTFPPLVHKDGNNSSKVPNNMNSVSTNNAARPTMMLTTTSPTLRPSPSIQPSWCVFAIISCCSTATSEVNYPCFEQFGCSGPFWDASPCDSEYGKAAVESALNFYNLRG